MSNINKLNNKFKPKGRSIQFNTEFLPEYTYILCEGKKTEPYYIQAIVDEINKKYSKYTQQTRIKVFGTGRNTRSLLKYAREQVEHDMPEAANVWVVYDKDDFPYDDFDNTEKSAQNKKDNKRKYRVAWSNQCFELWLLLHFQDMDSNLDRKQYIEKLKKYIPTYRKNLKDIYEKVRDKIPQAIARAKKQYEGYDKYITASKRSPATRVYELL